MKKLKIILQSKYLFKILTLIFLLLAVIYTKYYKFTSKYDINDNTFSGIVLDYKIKDNYINITIKGKEKLLVRYNYHNLEFNNLNFGDKILVKGKLKIPSENRIFNNFNYKKYLYNNKIYYLVEASSIDKIENNKNIIYTVKNILYERINKLKSKDYIKTLILGDSSLSKEVKDSYRINGISHLFSISGMHISFILGIIYLYLDKISYNKKIKYIISTIILILYLLLAYTPSLLRVTIMYSLISINNILKLNIKKIDIMMLVLIISIIINPFIIYHIGFIYSYIISLFLILFKNKSKNKLFSVLNITIIAFIVSLPITIYTNYEINFLSIIINILIVPVVGIIILSLAIITLIFPIFDDIMFFFTNYLERFSLLIDDINIFKIILAKPNILIIVVYYMVILIILKNKKYFYIFIFLIIIHKLYPYYNSNLEVTMFDVGQGDSILLKLPYNKGNILIDTGPNKDYDTMKNNIIPYLKSIGISKIDYLIITHGDEDHIGSSISLIDNFKIEKVILNKDSYTDLEKDLIKELKSKKIKYSNKIDKLNIKGNYLYFLNNKEFDNENDNSNIIYFEYLKYKFLFMGDASSTTEEYLLDNYNLKNVSFLKVGHHGSKTSSSREFINSINPKISLISVGKNNYYGHPNKEVLDNLNKSRIYRTDIDGSIMFKIKNNKLKIKTCSP